VAVPPTDNVSRYRQGATVTIRTTDGRTSTSTVFEPKGAAALGISWDDVDAKYRTLVPLAGVPKQQIEASLATIHDFRDVDQVSKLIDLLRV
jgi:2-methylcitrate dehydratase PrpD